MFLNAFHILVFVVIALLFYIFPKDKKTTIKKSIPCILTILLINSFLTVRAQAPAKPDTVSVGIYIVSVHDIDFKQKEYVISFWLWLKYKNKDFDFVKKLEVPQAKSVDKSFSVLDSSGDQVSLQMKMQCIMKDNWKIANFPFDQQKLRLSIENSQYDYVTLFLSRIQLVKILIPGFYCGDGSSTVVILQGNKSL